MVISVDYSKPEISDNRMNNQDQEFFYLDAEPLYQPSPNHIGDIQIPLDQRSKTCSLVSVRCFKHGCEVYCPGASPFMRNQKFINYGKLDIIS